MFSSPTKSDRQVDIVIAVTPRVLRAPAVTPHDELLRPSGTTMSPTTGSLAEMIRDNEREDQMAAANAARVAAHRAAKDVNVVINLPDTPPAYVPATKSAIPAQNSTEIAAVDSSAKGPNTEAKSVSLSQGNTAEVSPREIPVAKTNFAETTAGATDLAPKSTAVAALNGLPQPRPIDVNAAIKSLIAPTATTSAAVQANQEGNLINVSESLKPKEPAVTSLAPSNTSIAQLLLLPGKNEMSVGEKRQVALQLNSEAPLSMASVTLTFDPGVIKVNRVSAGTAVAGAPTPAIMQTIDPNGRVMVSVQPSSGAIRGDSGILVLEIEAIGVGNSGLAVNLQDTHIVAASGRNILLEIEPCALAVKK
jgi:hypothetical protein